MTPEILRAIDQARRQRRDAILLSRLADGAQHLLLRHHGRLLPTTGADTIAGELHAAATQAASTGRSATLSILGEDWFVQVHAPPLRLILVGAVHVAQALSAMAQACGIAVTVIDPRVGFATEARFPAAALLHQWPAEALALLTLDRHTALVTLSHEARLDDPALDTALRGPACYIGALGSRRTQAARRERLAALGHDETALARLHGPVGLPIGAIGPAEIAVSILAQMIAIRRGNPTAQAGGAAR